MPNDVPFYALDNPGAFAQAREQKPGERLWTMTKKGHTCHAELRPGPEGELVELQIFADDEFRLGGVHVSRECAETEGSRKQEALRVRGWTAAPHSGGAGIRHKFERVNRT